MPTDISQPIPQGYRPEWELPKILDIKIQRIPFEARKPRNFKSALADYKEAVEFLVRTSAPIPPRALGPALYVGDSAVIEVQLLEGDSNSQLYRFLALNLNRLEPGSPISWGWINTPKEQRVKTPFSYEETIPKRGV
jgi:hypothetical protein